MREATHVVCSRSIWIVKDEGLRNLPELYSQRVGRLLSTWLPSVFYGETNLTALLNDGTARRDTVIVIDEVQALCAFTMSFNVKAASPQVQHAGATRS
jgi:hypothetical protein